jgi:hypothetical protein
MCCHRSNIWHTWPSCVPSFHGCGWPFCLGLCFLIFLSYLHHWILQLFFFLLVNSTFCFPWLSILEHMFFNYLLLVVTLTSTTFTSIVIFCVLLIGCIFATVIDFPWHIFYISIKFGQFVILCPFKPQMWYAYEDVFYGFWFCCATFVVATMVCSFFFLHVSTLWLIIP